MKTSIKFRLCLSTLFVVVAIQQVVASTGTTYAVGNCKPALRSFLHIQDALNATPPPTMVQVCPGTYPEQVTIVLPVTLQGVSSGDSDQAIIVPPMGGLMPNATDDFGSSLAVQLWVDNASGPVNISNLTVDGTGNGIGTCPPSIVGIFYQNSSGTVNRLTSRNQKGDGCGEAVLFEGGSSNPSVTIENSSIHDFDGTGIYTETNSGVSELTATIKANVVTVTNPSSPFIAGIDAGSGATTTITGNFVAGVAYGTAALAGAVGSIFGNTIMNTTGEGIGAGADGVSVTSNKIFNSPFGINLFTSLATIQGNIVTNVSVGIEFKPDPNFACAADPNVHSNTISDAATGVDQVPGGVITTNNYYNVATIKTGC